MSWIRIIIGRCAAYAKVLVSFKQAGALIPEVFSNFEKEDLLSGYLKTKNALYHKKCYVNYNAFHLNKLKNSLKRKVRKENVKDRS